MNGLTGHKIARQEVIKDGFYHCTLSIEKDSVQILVVNDQSVSQLNVGQILDETGKWIDRGLEIGKDIMKVIELVG